MFLILHNFNYFEENDNSVLKCSGAKSSAFSFPSESYLKEKSRREKNQRETTTRKKLSEEKSHSKGRKGSTKKRRITRCVIISK